MLADVQHAGMHCSVIAGSILQDRREPSDACARDNATPGIPGGVRCDRGANERERVADKLGCMDDEDAVKRIGYASEWIATKLEPRTACIRIAGWIKTMTPQRENGWSVLKVAAQVIIGALLTTLAGSAAYTAKTLSNHESRLSVVEDWKRERSAKMDEIARDIGEMKTHNAGVDSQARQTDMLVRDVSAQLRVVSDTLIRMQEGQSAIREKMVSLQVATDEMKGSK